MLLLKCPLPLHFLKDSLTNRIGPFIHSLNTRLYISCDTILDCDKSCALCLQHYCPSFPRIWKTKQKNKLINLLMNRSLMYTKFKSNLFEFMILHMKRRFVDIIKHARFPNWKHGPDPRACEVYKNSIR